jgi:3-hydroxyisobutyrate dehydrogenase-like beta-hydroxyacid dehydrogenase
MSKPKLGYIGVGLMGLPMVRHLMGKGYAIAAFDIVPERRAAAADAGARAAASAVDAVAGADIVVLNLPTTEAVEDAMFGKGGVAKAMRPPQRLVDFSTITVEKGRAFARRLLDETGCGWVDAPVSGGPPASGSGSLTVMAGGRTDDIDAIRPFMADVAQRFTPMGPSGSGLVAKMINQMIVGCGHAVMAEALVMAETAGIDAGRIPECLAGGHADGSLLQKLYPRMAARDFTPQGYARQLLKDLEMVSAFAGQMKSPMPMTGEALNLYRLLVHLGHAESDTAAIVKVFDR